jgi:diaminohydroxyphosphoribosylaminopyrimidine deaminase/5-amino-6-(5-phosphoribosylamino)uracil reductase
MERWQMAVDDQMAGGLPTDTAETFMGLAIDLAKRALGRTSPNPAVGAVVVRDGVVIGCGHTMPPGGLHAELVALREAGEMARGADLYVTLEPCSHWGRTPPCTDAILAASIRRVYAAMPDPFPAVNGDGIARLRAGAVEVLVGTCAEEAARVSEGFLKRVRTGLPFVTAKYAMTLDGRIATRTGHSRWVTGPDARRDVHRLRDRSDAILIGAGTLRADDPELTTRLPEREAGWNGPHHPLRVILLGTGSLPENARIFSSDMPGRTIVATTERTAIRLQRECTNRDIEILTIEGASTHVDHRSLLLALSDRGVNTLLVEGGAETLYGFFSEGLVDRVRAYIAPNLVGGRDAPGPLGGEGSTRMDRGWTMSEVRHEALGEDLLIEGCVERRMDREVSGV